MNKNKKLHPTNAFILKEVSTCGIKNISLKNHALQAEGHWFESINSHQIKGIHNFVGAFFCIFLRQSPRYKDLWQNKHFIYSDS